MATTESIRVDTGELTDRGALPSPRRGRKWLWIGVAIALVVAGVAVWWFMLRAEPATEATFQQIQQLTEVSTGTFQTTVTAESTVAAAESEDLSFESAGTVTAVNVEVGDVVQEGDVLATIDSAELEAQLAEAQAEYDDLAAQLADDTDDDASEEQIELDEARLAVAADNLENAQDALDGTELVADISGTITTVDLTVGEELSSGGQGGTDLTGSDAGSGNSSAVLGTESDNPLGGDTSNTSSAHITIVSVGSYSVDLSIDTNDIDSIEIGQEVTLTEATASTSGFGGPGGFLFGGGGPGGQGFVPDFGGLPEATDEGSEAEVATDAATATGTVTDIAVIADASSGVANYTVTVGFTDETGEFFVGTTVLAEIIIEQRTDVVQVPNLAVNSDDSGSTVIVAVDGTVDGTLETRNVTTGETSGGMTEITYGVEPGELVLIEIDIPTGGGFGGQLPTDGNGFPGAVPEQTQESGDGS